MQAVYTEAEGISDVPKVFGQLTHCDGSFIVAKNKHDNFTIEDLVGETIICKISFVHCNIKWSIEYAVGHFIEFDGVVVFATSDKKTTCDCKHACRWTQRRTSCNDTSIHH